nr:NADH dehydrogenase subunit 2 [Antarctophthirus microchir]
MSQFYLLMVVMGLLIVFSANSFWLSWLGLELSTLFFVPLLCKPRSWITNLSSWQYLIVQTSSSSWLVVTLLSVPQLGVLNISLPDNSMLWGTFLTIPILFKLAIPPFQTWVLNLSDAVNWTSFFVLNGIQKLGPLFLLITLQFPNNLPFFTFILILTCLMCVLGVVDGSLRRFLTYSSLLNVSWCLYLIPLSMSTSLVYMLTYLFVLVGLVSFLRDLNLYTMMSFYGKLASYNRSYQLSTIAIMLSLFGLPPFVGFHLKLEALLHFVDLMFPLALVLLNASILLLVAYLHMLQLSFLYVPNNKVCNKLSPVKVTILMSISSLVSISNLLLL